MKEFESQWASWNADNPEQVSAKSAKSPNSTPSGTCGTDPTRAIAKTEDHLQAIPDDDLALGVAYFIIKALAERDAVQTVYTAWKALTPAQMIQVPEAAIKQVTRLPTDNPLQLLEWKESWMSLINAAKLRPYPTRQQPAARSTASVRSEK